MNNDEISEFKVRLKEAISVRGIKQVELAEKTGLSRSAISQYLSGYTMPKSDRIYKLAKALDVSESWLMGFNVPMQRYDCDYQINLKDIGIDVNIDCDDTRIKILRALELYEKYINSSAKTKDTIDFILRTESE